MTRYKPIHKYVLIYIYMYIYRVLHININLLEALKKTFNSNQIINTFRLVFILVYKVR